MPEGRVAIAPRFTHGAELERGVHPQAAMQQKLARASSGVVAGIAATAVMSLFMLGARRWGLLGEPPPRRLTRRILSHLGPVSPRGRALDAAATVAHFAFGATMGGLFGLASARPTLTRGVLFGFGVWAVSYTGVLPRLGLMPPALLDRPGRPTSMILAHLVYGVSLAELVASEFGAIQKIQRSYPRVRALPGGRSS